MEAEAEGLPAHRMGPAQAALANLPGPFVFPIEPSQPCYTSMIKLVIL